MPTHPIVPPVEVVGERATGRRPADDPSRGQVQQHHETHPAPVGRRAGPFSACTARPRTPSCPSARASALGGGNVCRGIARALTQAYGEKSAGCATTTLSTAAEALVREKLRQRQAVPSAKAMVGERDGRAVGIGSIASDLGTVPGLDAGHIRPNEALRRSPRVHRDECGGEVRGLLPKPGLRVVVDPFACELPALVEGRIRGALSRGAFEGRIRGAPSRGAFERRQREPRVLPSRQCRRTRTSGRSESST